MKIEYRRGDLFQDLQDKVIYLHSCNSQNIWGAGVALKFKDLFPKAYSVYKSLDNNPGDGYVVSHDNFKVGCLITSKFYGKLKDSPKKILVQTYMALQKMLESIAEDEVTIYSPKINSGYFNTPWDATEKVILRACAKTNKKINRVGWGE